MQTETDHPSRSEFRIAPFYIPYRNTQMLEVLFVTALFFTILLTDIITHSELMPDVFKKVLVGNLQLFSQTPMQSDPIWSKCLEVWTSLMAGWSSVLSVCDATENKGGHTLSCWQNHNMSPKCIMQRHPFSVSGITSPELIWGLL